MSHNRFARRPDKVTQQIVDELRALGYCVVYLGLPVDLAVTHTRWEPNEWRMIEVKSARKKKTGDVVLDKRQRAQAEFCEAHGVPYVTTTREALQAMGEV